MSGVRMPECRTAVIDNNHSKNNFLNRILIASDGVLEI
jgi:hypothetical protein